MSANILMLILTLAEGGLYSAAFVNTGSVAECERRAATVRAILQTGPTQIERIDCLPSEARFEPFVHGAGQAGARHFYRIHLDAGRVRVERRQADAGCRPEPGQVYCVTSGQKMLALETS